MFDVDFYKLKNEKCPIKDFIFSLDIKKRAKTFRIIGLLKEYGNQLGEPFSKPLKNGLFELRIQFGSDTVRVLYFFCKGKMIILTNGFVKKTQKTPEEEINLALKYKEEYLRREV